MRRLLISALLLCSAPVSAQHLAPEDYIFPLRNVAGLYSANFGEMRPNHFHSGIDIKTDGMTGNPYSPRPTAISHASPSRRAAMDAPSTSPIPTARLPYMGTSRSSATTSKIRTRGALPHPAKQHQSLSLGRPVSAQTGRAVRLVGKYRLVRRPAPAFRDPRLPHAADPQHHFQRRDPHPRRHSAAPGETLLRRGGQRARCPGARPAPPRRAGRKTPGRYALKQEGALSVGGRGYFILEATDRKNDVSNTFGLWRIREFADEDPIFELRIDGFAFDQTRYCNAVTHYPMQVASRNEVIRLTRLDGCIDDFYPVLKTRPC